VRPSPEDGPPPIDIRALFAVIKEQFDKKGLPAHTQEEGAIRLNVKDTDSHILPS